MRENDKEVKKKLGKNIMRTGIRWKRLYNWERERWNW